MNGITVRHGSLFSGIGGFDLVAEWMGWENVFHCETEPFCRTVLQYHFPKSKCHEDIRKTGFSKYKGKIDVLTGGFPCQPYSVAGKRLGKEDSRHLWPEMLRAVQQIRPDWVVAENVFGLVSWNQGVVFEEVHTDLEGQGYEVQSYVLPAAAVNAPHRRDRVWIVAHRKKRKRRGKKEKQPPVAANTNNGQQPEQQKSHSAGRKRASASRRCFGVDPGDGNLHRVIAKGVQKLGTGSCILQAIAANTNISGLQKKRAKKQAAGTKRYGKLDINVAHPYGRRQPGKKYGQKKSGWPSKESIPNNWENFPVESPICSGNDGVPTIVVRQRIREDSMGYLSEEEIDKIISKAYRKWRNEAIKAGGNAIVPQVALRIFQVIQLIIDQEECQQCLLK